MGIDLWLTSYQSMLISLSYIVLRCMPVHFYLQVTCFGSQLEMKSFLSGFQTYLVSEWKLKVLKTTFFHTYL